MLLHISVLFEVRQTWKIWEKERKKARNFTISALLQNNSGKEGKMKILQLPYYFKFIYSPKKKKKNTISVFFLLLQIEKIEPKKRKKTTNFTISGFFLVP